MEDLTTDTIEEADESEALAKQFFKPAYTWRGLSLRPYTGGTDFLFNQILDTNDAPLTVFLTFIFIHICEPDRLVALCWDKLEFRKALIAWIDELGPLSLEDRKSAMELFEEVRGWARKSSIEVVPDELTQKKTRVSRRRRSHG